MTVGKGKKKPPVFIGLGAVHNRNLNTLFREPGSPGLSKDWIKTFYGLCPLAGVKIHQSLLFRKKRGRKKPSLRENSVDFRCLYVRFTQNTSQ